LSFIGKKKMQNIRLLKNTVQDYVWGSPSAIPELLGKKNPDQRPQAELWMGAHPKAPSMVYDRGRWRSLKELIDHHPQDILGVEVAARFDNTFPYLFKVLAAAKPLSIQAHPSRKEAREGFESENRRKIPMDAPNRNYKDENHKPECICALSPFWALSGFRDFFEICALVSRGCPLGLARELNGFKKQLNPIGLKHFFTELMNMDPAQQQQAISEALENAQRWANDDPAFDWITRLADEYPSDIGILAPLLLNLVQLKPGQALFLSSGVLHAYLQGVGIELMANSDNVLRGGLTSKHIDVPELLKMLNFEGSGVDVLEAVEKNKNERVYPSPAEEFVLSVISVSRGNSYQCSGPRSVEIMLSADGKATVRDTGSKAVHALKKGDSIIIPAAVKGYRISGNATIFKAAVPV